MPKIKQFAVTVSLCAALSLSACSGGGDNGSAGPPVTPEFQRLLEDARYEMEEGNLDQAGVLFDEALEIDRENPGLWIDIARFRFRGGEHVGALEAADLALTLDPEFAPALLMRAQLVRDAYGLEASLAWFERALVLHPENTDLLAEYAGTLGDLGRAKDMLKTVRALAELDPRDVRVHYLQAVLAVRGNDPVLASSLLKRSGMREAGVPSAILVDALGEMQQGNFDTAATSLEGLLARQPGNVRVMELLARAMWLNGRDREIVDRFASRAEAADASAYMRMLVGRSLERLGQRDRAAPMLELAYAGQSGELAVLNVPQELRAALPAPTRQLREMIAAGNSGEARQYASGLVSRFSGSSDIIALAGDAALATGDSADALNLYSRASQIRRPWPLTRKIIHAYREQGDDDAADTLLIRHVRSEPLNTEAAIMYAERSAQTGDWLRTAVLLDNAIERGAGNDPKLLELRLEAARSLGKETDVEKYLATLAQVSPDGFIN
ncbi:tetratricopeptide repeat protein [Erythrobacter insulae]|nr:tetratricopeptide repeat protein [Erythrobacter insulae]